MSAVHSADQVRQAEHAHERLLADGTLMMRASHGLAVTVARGMRERLGGVAGRRVVILAGTGSNGGDALHAGALLVARGADVRALAIGERAHDGGAAALRRAGGRVEPWSADSCTTLANADVVIDGILGIGASGGLREPLAAVVDQANGVGAWRVAADIPTGVDPDTGAVGGIAFRADATVTFAALKPGLLVAPGKQYAGDVRVVDIGIGDSLGAPVARTFEAVDLASVIDGPQFDDYKYRRGVTGIAAGSAQYRGAGLLCASAALAGRTGMIVVLDRGDGLAEDVIRQHPEAVRTDEVDHERVTAWACGPGFVGTTEDHATVEAVLRTALPVVLDAGALTVLAERADLRDLLRTRPAPSVLTPHEGEFLRLGGRLGQDRIASARDLSARMHAVVLLKGPGTIICAPDGTCLIDRAGTPALATAGSGDVLTGCIASLLAAAAARRSVSSDPAAARVAAAGCWLHGMAGRLAQEAGSVSASMIAGALVRVQGPYREQSEHGAS